MAFVLFTRVPELDLARYDRMMLELIWTQPPAGRDPPHCFGGSRERQRLRGMADA